MYHLEHLPVAAVAGKANQEATNDINDNIWCDLGYDFKKSAVPLRSGKYQVTNGSVRFGQDSFLLDPSEKRNISVHFHQPRMPKELDQDAPTSPLIYGGFLQVRQASVVGDNQTIQDKPLHVPYFGVLGNQYDLPILDKVVSSNAKRRFESI